MSADDIAQVIADLRTRRVRNALPDNQPIHELALDHAADAVVVDATSIYESLVAKDEPIYIYEDHPCIIPPWSSAAICYRNDHGNVVVMQIRTVDRPKSQRPVLWQDTAEPVDWTNVRWTTDAFVWLGGRSATLGGVTTTGPLHMWRYAITETGAPADIRWVHLHPEMPMQVWNTAQLVLLGALNFCACRNVELIEPVRPRAQRRRLARLGVRVHTITVFPAGRSTRSERGERAGGVPLHSVRGHFARYGPEYGRGLLFGRLSGRFWIPQHARGEVAAGRVEKDYQLSRISTPQGDK